MHGAVLVQARSPPVPLGHVHSLDEGGQDVMLWGEVVPIHFTLDLPIR